ncbi:hypothetical protein NDU88_005149, partial [Pleurodeles waltl]
AHSTLSTALLAFFPPLTAICMVSLIMRFICSTKPFPFGLHNDVLTCFIPCFLKINLHYSKRQLRTIV